MIGLLGGALFVVFALYLIVGDPGSPQVPDGDVALIDGIENGDITQESINTLIDHALAGQQGEPPKPDSIEYKGLELQAINVLIQRRWTAAEFSERGLEVTPEEVAAELKTTIDQVGQDKFDKQVAAAGLTDQEVRDEVRNGLIESKLGEDQQTAAEVTDAEVEQAYEANIDAFTEPANREVRVILNSRQDQVNKALKLLRADDSDKNWKTVAAKYSQDEVTKGSGGLLTEPIAETGSSLGEDFDAAVFAASEGDIIGPVKTERGYWGIEVIAVNEEKVPELDDALRQSISTSLAPAKQQLVVGREQAALSAKWLARTTCSDHVYDLIAAYVDAAAKQADAEGVPNQVTEAFPSCPADPVDRIDEEALVSDAETAAEASGGEPNYSEISPQVQVPSPIAPGTAAPELLAQSAIYGPVRPKRVGDPCQDVDEDGVLLTEQDPCGPDPKPGDVPATTTPPLGLGG